MRAARLDICTVSSDRPGVHRAASQLQGWLFEVDNLTCESRKIDVVITNVTSLPEHSCLAVGPAAASLFPKFRFPKISSYSIGESYILQDAGGGSYILTGNPADKSMGSRGTLYSAIEFAERLGIRFLTADTTALTKNANLCSLPDFQAAGMPKRFHFSPPLEYRQVLAWDTSKNAEFAQKKRFNAPGRSLDAGGIVYASPPGFVHTSYHLLADGASNSPSSTGDIWKDNNEWFWPRAGVDPTGSVYGQLCWSNASLIEFIKGRVLSMLRAQPDASVISVSQNDNYIFCNSSAERAIYEAEGGSKIGPILRAVNNIADAVAKEFPERDVSIDTLAYQWTRSAPLHTVPRPNVIVRLCSIECNFGAPLTDPTNFRFQTDIKSWGQLSNRTWIWNYVTDFANYVQPWPDYFNLAPNTNFYMDNGVRGLFQEAAYQSYGSDLAHVKTYLMSKLLWNPAGTNVNETITEFLNLYYGTNVAHRIAEYMVLWSKSVRESNFFLGESVPYTSAYLDPKSLLESAVLTEPAPGDEKNKADRLRTAKMSTLYVILLRWDEIMAFAKTHNVTWPYKEKTVKEAFYTFSSIYNESGATLLSEDGKNLTWLREAAHVPR